MGAAQAACAVGHAAWQPVLWFLHNGLPDHTGMFPRPQAHYSCHVCPPPVAAHAYFNRARDLLQHMR